MESPDGSKSFQGSEIDIPAILGGKRIPNAGYPMMLGGQPKNVFVNRYNVDDDGTFDPEIGNTVVLFNVPTDDPAAAITEIRRAVSVNMIPLYIYRPTTNSTPMQRVCAFFSISGQVVDAPQDFDWWKHSQISRNFSVYRIEDNYSEELSVYSSPNERYHLPFIEGRGRFWNMHVEPPNEDSGISESFEAVLGAVSRKSAIRNDIRPISLKWRHGGKVALAFERVKQHRCFSLEIDLPTIEQLKSGRFRTLGNVVAVDDPLQFALGLLAVLQERAAGWSSMGGTECQSSE